MPEQNRSPMPEQHRRPMPEQNRSPMPEQNRSPRLEQNRHREPIKLIGSSLNLILLQVLATFKSIYKPSSHPFADCLRRPSPYHTLPPPYSPVSVAPTSSPSLLPSIRHKTWACLCHRVEILTKDVSRGIRATLSFDFLFCLAFGLVIISSVLLNVPKKYLLRVLICVSGTWPSPRKPRKIYRSSSRIRLPPLFNSFSLSRFLSNYPWNANNSPRRPRLYRSNLRVSLLLPPQNPSGLPRERVSPVRPNSEPSATSFLPVPERTPLAETTSTLTRMKETHYSGVECKESLTSTDRMPLGTEDMPNAEPKPSPVTVSMWIRMTSIRTTQIEVGEAVDTRDVTEMTREILRGNS
ncbi:unnamed protein product [Cochlearia groenlandica]